MNIPEPQHEGGGRSVCTWKRRKDPPRKCRRCRGRSGRADRTAYSKCEHTGQSIHRSFIIRNNSLVDPDPGRSTSFCRIRIRLHFNHLTGISDPESDFNANPNLALYLTANMDYVHTKKLNFYNNFEGKK